MKITVVGSGRWGSCIAWYCSEIKKHDVMIYGLANAPDYRQLVETGKNDYITMPKEVQLTDDLIKAIGHADTIIVSIGAQHFRGFLQELKEKVELQGKQFVLCMKGLESSTGKRLTVIFEEELGTENRVAVWVGPGHVQDFYVGMPSCMLISSKDIDYTKFLVSELNSTLIRFYYGEDLLGAEIGAASKNVMGIAAGVLDGFGFSGMKGALMARGAREISKLVKAMGGDEITIYGLSHLGDYQATLFSEHSHNRMYGENYIKKVHMEKLAEGVDTSKALVKLSEMYGVELPISTAIYQMIFEKKDPKKTLESLFDRSTKFEF